MAQEGDWIYTLDEELHERLRDGDLDAMTDNTIARILTAISLSRIALTLIDRDFPVCVEVKKDEES